MFGRGVKPETKPLAEVFTWRPCNKHPDYKIAPAEIMCPQCIAEAYARSAKSKHDNKLAEIKEIAELVAPILAKAIATALHKS